jgi:hypothetical protein
MTDNATMKLQRAHVLELLRDAKYKHNPRYRRGRAAPLLKEPASVRRARSLVAKWDKKMRKLHERRDAKIERAAKHIETEILFGNFTKARKMIAQFAKTKIV